MLGAASTTPRPASTRLEHAVSGLHGIGPTDLQSANRERANRALVPLRILIVDGDQESSERLSSLVHLRSGASIRVLDPGAVSALTFANRPFDLVFVDPDEHPGLLDTVASLLPENRPLLAFVAESAKHACRAFELGAIDFLLKPIRRDRVGDCLTRARARLDRDPVRFQAASHAEFEGEPVRRSGFTREFWFRVYGARHCRVPVDSIDWITSEDDYVCVHAAGRQFMLRSSLGKVQASLDPAEFVRIHRTTLVQRSRLLSVQARRKGGSEALLGNGVKLAVGRVYLSRLPWRTRQP